MNESEANAAARGKNLPDARDLDDVTEIVGADVVAADPFADDVTQIVDLRPRDGDAGSNEVVDVVVADAFADDVTELVRRDVAAAAPGQSGFDRVANSSVQRTIPPEVPSAVPTAIPAGIPPAQSSQALWEPPRRPRSPEPEIASSRTRSSAGLLLATVVVLLAVIAALIIYIAVSGDTPTDSPSNEPVVEVNEDG